MKCLYINLDSAQARREDLEASFRTHAPAGWQLIRVPALGPADVEGVAGAITSREKACWKSHREAIFAALADAEDVLIVEDDTRFGPRTFEMIDRIRGVDASWDLLFTEVSLRVENMLSYAQRYPQLAAGGSVSVIDLARLGFTAAAGYMVRGASKAKLVALLDGAASLDRPYDFHLQDLTHAGRIRSLFCFPFITQPSPQAEDSQIQPDPFRLRDQMHLAFRRLMCLDRDLDALEPELERLEALHGERGAAMVGKVFGAMVSDAMRISAPGSVAPPRMEK
jgi:hypothetical protein